MRKKAFSNEYLIPVIVFFTIILFFLIIPLTAMIVLAKNRLDQMSSLAFDSLTTNETNDVGPFNSPENEDCKNLSLLTEFYPIPQSPYIYCHFVFFFTASENSNNKYDVDIVIDIEKGKRVLRAEWKNYNFSKGNMRRYHKYVFNYGALQTNDGLCLVYTRSENPIPARKQKLGFLVDLFLNNPSSPNKEIWTLNLQGELKKIVNVPTFDLRPRLFYRSFDISRLAGKINNLSKKNELHDYKIENDSLVQSDQWNEDYDGQFLFGLPGGGYLINKKAEKCVTYLLPGESESVVIPRNVLLEKLPQTPTLPKLVMWIPISTQKGPACLAYLDAPHFPIFEFHLDQRNDRAVEDWVKFIGYGNEMRPIMTMENNQIILFASAKKEMQRDILEWPKYWNKNNMLTSKYFTLPTRALPQTPGGQPSERIIFHVLPQPIEQYCIIPLCDDRLLGYGFGAFWSFCWDGSDIRQLFPRDKEFPLIPWPMQSQMEFASE